MRHGLVTAVLYSVGERGGGKMKKEQSSRTSVVLDPTLRENLKCLAQKSGLAQGEIIRNALRYYLREKEGLEPDKLPKLTMEISY